MDNREMLRELRTNQDGLDQPIRVIGTPGKEILHTHFVQTSFSRMRAEGAYNNRGVQIILPTPAVLKDNFSNWETTANYEASLAVYLNLETRLPTWTFYEPIPVTVRYNGDHIRTHAILTNHRNDTNLPQRYPRTHSDELPPLLSTAHWYVVNPDAFFNRMEAAIQDAATLVSLGIHPHPDHHDFIHLSQFKGSSLLRIFLDNYENMVYKPCKTHEELFTQSANMASHLLDKIITSAGPIDWKLNGKFLRRIASRYEPYETDATKWAQSLQTHLAQEISTHAHALMDLQ